MFLFLMETSRTLSIDQPRAELCPAGPSTNLIATSLFANIELILSASKTNTGYVNPVEQNKSENNKIKFFIKFLLVKFILIEYIECKIAINNPILLKLNRPYRDLVTRPKLVGRPKATVKAIASLKTPKVGFRPGFQYIFEPYAPLNHFFLVYAFTNLSMERRIYKPRGIFLFIRESTLDLKLP